MFGERAAIAVLGPTRPDPQRVGRVVDAASSAGAQLARLGYALVVMGDGHTATAAARGARQADGPVLCVAPGLTGSQRVAHIDVPGVQVEARASALSAIERVLEVAEAVIVLPGDLHALSVLTQIWAWGLEPDAPFRQIILLGEGWPEMVRALADAAHLDQKTRAMVTFAREPGEAVEALRYYVAPR
ncbi:MAG: hypothetical protein IT385_05360 [Deltaproteobacteria bacterium]|nr:hypothetical protein [Deltaproteobacteria bacterium]